MSVRVRVKVEALDSKHPRPLHLLELNNRVSSNSNRLTRDASSDVLSKSNDDSKHLSSR